MDATCKVQDNIHVFRLVHNMCPEFWVHIKLRKAVSFSLYGLVLTIAPVSFPLLYLVPVSATPFT